MKDFEIKKHIDGSSERIPIYLELRKGDRVIHLENMSMKNRYLQHSTNVYEQINDSFGVMNGDVGKIVAFVKGSDLSFIDKNGNIDDETKEAFADSDDVLYIAVKYMDVDTNANPLEYIVFYKTDINMDFENDKYYRENNIYTVNSSDLFNLDLAYALTVHKLQGSQAKLIICVMYSVGYSRFISRNMLYTAITRAEEGIYLVGNVLGKDSIVNKGRKIEQNILRDTIADKIFEDDVK